MSFEAFSTDTTALQSAWSAIDSDYYGRSEMRAEAAFDECVWCYVNCKRLFAPVPGNDPGHLNPLMKLWFHAKDDSLGRNHTPLVTDAALNTTIDRATTAALKQAFVQDVSVNQDAYRSWLEFQFCHRVTDEYISRMGDKSFEAVESARESLGDVLDWDDLSVARRAFEGIELSKWHRAREATIGSRADYALSYAFSLFKRGRQYGIEMRDKQYSPHWSRMNAVCLNDIDTASEVKSNETEGANWGEIVRRCVREDVISREAVTDVLESLRHSVQETGGQVEIDDTKQQVSMLAKAGVTARFGRYEPLYHKAADALHDGLESVPWVGKPLSKVVRIVTFLGKTEFVQKVDARGTRLLSWNNYRKAFYLPGVHGNPKEPKS